MYFMLLFSNKLIRNWLNSVTDGANAKFIWKTYIKIGLMLFFSEIKNRNISGHFYIQKFYLIKRL